MRLETFFEEFDLFADALDAIAKMRELVLELAIQGALVPHLPEEPAVPYNSVDDDMPLNISEVPENWRVVLLSDAIKNRSGNSKLIKGRLHKEPGLERFQAFSASGPDVWCDDFEHEGRAIIVSAVGARCGKAFKASGKWSAIANTNIARPEPTLFDLDFAYLVLNNEHFWVRGGSAQPFVKFPPSLDRHFALPPLAEQRRIVAKVDELMALCDRLEAQQQERETRHAALARASLACFADAPTPANLDLLFHKSYTIPPSDLRKAILTLAVEGKLVPQDATDEPASVSVDLVAKDARKAVRDGVIRRHGLDEQFDDSELPEQPPGWRWTRLPEVTRPVPYAIKRGPFGSAIRKDMFVPTGFKIYEQQHAISGDFTKGRYYINAAKFEELSAFELHPDEILVSCSGTVGKVAIVPKNIERGIINQALLKLSLHQSALLNEYFLILFPAFFMETETLANLSGTAQKNIPGMEVLRAMPFPLPPLAEQRRVVAKVDELMALVDALEVHLATARATAETLAEAVIAELTETGWSDFRKQATSPMVFDLRLGEAHADRR